MTTNAALTIPNKQLEGYNTTETKKGSPALQSWSQQNKKSQRKGGHFLLLLNKEIRFLTAPLSILICPQRNFFVFFSRFFWRVVLAYFGDKYDHRKNIAVAVSNLFHRTFCFILSLDF